MVLLNSKEISESLHTAVIYKVSVSYVLAGYDKDDMNILHVDSLTLGEAEFLGLLIAERFNIVVKVEE